MAVVWTTQGDIDESLLEVRMVERDEGNVIALAREWYKDGEMVRRDAWVTLKSGLELGAKAKEI